MEWGSSDCWGGTYFKIIFLLLFVLLLYNNSSSCTPLSAYCVPGPVLSSSAQDPAQRRERAKRWDPGSVAGWVCSLTDYFSQLIFTKY